MKRKTRNKMVLILWVLMALLVAVVLVLVNDSRVAEWATIIYTFFMIFVSPFVALSIAGGIEELYDKNLDRIKKAKREELKK